jgi:hypothetical protein
MHSLQRELLPVKNDPGSVIIHFVRTSGSASRLRDVWTGNATIFRQGFSTRMAFLARYDA